MAYDEFTAKMVRKCERLEQENDQLKARLQKELDKHEPMKSAIGASNELTRALQQERDKLKAELAQCRQDMEAAAGDLPVPMPSPGTDMAKLLSANVILKQRAARLREALEFIAHQDKPGNWAVERANRAIEEDKA